MHNKPVALIILDGVGLSRVHKGNAVAQADMPHIKNWLTTMPHTELAASGTAVGLPEGVVGNSEVGHYTIGAGRIREQATTMIDQHIKDGTLFTNPVFSDACKKTLQTHSHLHIIGLLSDAQIHGDQDHIVAYVKAAHEHGIKTTYIHAILDGQDTPPHTAQERIQKIIHDTQPYGGLLVTIQGRFYALDRNKNYERTAQSYRILTDHAAPLTQHWQTQLYPPNRTEEFCEPMRIQAAGYLQSDDTVLFTSCRADRIRQLVQALTGNATILGKQQSIAPLTLLSPVSYGTQVPTQPLYTMPQIDQTLKEVLCTAERTVFSIAETEKYAHITYFFNGEREQVLPCEVRHLIPSLRAKDFVHHPELRAREITDTVLRSVEKDPKDFYLINYANADLVGHSGNFEATKKALEALDLELGRLYETIVDDMDGTLFITGDHGNAEQKIDPVTGNPSPMHTTNPVPFLVVTKTPRAQSMVAQMHGLADIAPVILEYMGISVPREMTGSQE